MNKDFVFEQLAKLGITPKKGKGQNFLIDQSVVDQIMAYAKVTKNDTVIEVGPGLGFLTQSLIQEAGKVIAIELEEHFCTYLESKFNKPKHFAIRCEDVLDAKIEEKDYSLIANIPYAITAPLLQHFLYNTNPPKRMIIMVQREVGERICATQGDHSILSLSVQRVATAKILFPVPANCFYPQPKVDSVVVEISNITKHDEAETKAFFRLIKMGFLHKRKKLINNLVLPSTVDPEKRKRLFLEVGIKENARAQELSLEQWTKLLKLL